MLNIFHLERDEQTSKKNPFRTSQLAKNMRRHNLCPKNIRIMENDWISFLILFKIIIVSVAALKRLFQRLFLFVYSFNDHKDPKF
jgi:hypothetical protein